MVDLYELTHSSPSTPAETWPANKRREAIIGEAITVGTLAPIPAPTMTITRAPTGSTAAWSGLSLAPDRPGLFESRALFANGSSVVVALVAFAAGAVDNYRPTDRLSPENRRRFLRGLINSPRCTPATIAATLESGDTGPTFGIGGALIGEQLDPSTFGAPQTWHMHEGAAVTTSRR